MVLTVTLAEARTSKDRRPHWVHCNLEHVALDTEDYAEAILDTQPDTCSLLASGNGGGSYLLTLLLRSVTVNGGSTIAIAAKEVLQSICSTLCLHKDQREALQSAVLC